MLAVLVSLQALTLAGALAGFIISMANSHYVTALGFASLVVSQIIGLIWSTIVSDRGWMSASVK